MTKTINQRLNYSHDHPPPNRQTPTVERLGDGYCHSNLYFGPFDCFFSLMEWNGEDLRQKMLEICRFEIDDLDREDNHYPEMPKQHWEQLIEKLENL